MSIGRGLCARHLHPASQARFAQAAVLFGAASLLRERSAAPAWRTDRDIHAGALRETREGLGEPAFTAAWYDGRRMSLEQIQLVAGG